MGTMWEWGHCGNGTQRDPGDDGDTMGMRCEGVRSEGVRCKKDEVQRDEVQRGEMQKGEM